MTFTELIDTLHRLEDKLRVFEDKYQLRSKDFYDLMQAEQLEESHDFVRWLGYYELWLDAMAEYTALLMVQRHPLLKAA
jgi:hypothetical protein